jgi:hypothetical protein
VEEASLCDKERSGKPVTATDESHLEHVEKVIGENCQIKLKNTAVELGISKERVGHIIKLGFGKVCASWVSGKLTDR